jgi:hypothetical protein
MRAFVPNTSAVTDNCDPLELKDGFALMVLATALAEERALCYWHRWVQIL